MEAAFCYCQKMYLLASFHITLTLALLFVVISHGAPLSFNYKQFSNTGNTLNLTADVYQDREVLQLTRNEKDSLGRVTYYKLFHLWDMNSEKVTDFTTHFYFTMNTPNKSYCGDGITFFMAKPNFPLPVPRDGKGIGLVSSVQLSDSSYTHENPFVAVEFDTSSNEGDPAYDHAGIDVNSITPAYTTEWFTSKDERGYDAYISYNSSSNNLIVTFTGYKDNITIEQHLYYVVNLRDVLPDWVEFGFTSATVWFYEYHTLSSWSFNSSSDFEEHKGESKTRLIIGLSVGAGVLIGVLVLTWLVTMKLRNRGMEDVLDSDLAMDNDFERNTGPRKFSYEELARATNNFAKEEKIGEGGFGGGSKQGVKEYASEVKIISQLRHKNLVQLIGWCHQQNDLLLIYEFEENGSLDSYLFKRKGPLTWNVRYNIARGMASAVLYLHEEWKQCVLHRDIKASNVMLDSNFNAKLGDFGLARLIDHEIESKTTVLAGTLGYMPPEAATRDKASRESVIYGFGVVALEIACGRKAFGSSFIEEQKHLVEWILELYGKGDILKAADPSLCRDFDENEMKRIMIVGLWCTHRDYLLRPTMRQVVQVLNFEAPLPILPSQMPSTSSNSSLTASSQSSTTFDVISPSVALLHGHTC
ncbi:hypothetical protein Lal_00007451 [Lupinus albus]|uniref:non-specific serine/threonine protein kinase n=1 Tax=Lupinus albus TaxID=3870 RepID=A0A6A5MKK8_LUPAL|nr:putative protein kinase RLK-Pelle-L-LEC family [Lupinus albus]KAF1874836.1 hypothetical protein Lal_00007451 [Lupinus albus]